MGFDVDYCNDLVKVLDVKVEIVEMFFFDCILVLVLGCVDVIVVFILDILEWVKIIGMSIFYFVFVKVVLICEDIGIVSYEDFKGCLVGGIVGIFEVLVLEKDSKVWGDVKGSFCVY